MLQALVDGSSDVEAMADLAIGQLRAKIPQLQRALAGRCGPHQRFLLAQQLAHIDSLDQTIAAVSAEVAERLRPFEDLIARLDAIPGVGRMTAEVVLAEVGTDVKRFPTAGQLVSWAGMCPGQHESAGKQRSGKTRKGNKALASALVEAAHAAGHTKDTYLSAQYHRLLARRGRKRAAVAVGHTILVIIYHLLSRPGTLFEDLGAHFFTARDKEAAIRRHVRALEAAGYHVELNPKAA
jgi:transposase